MEFTLALEFTFSSQHEVCTSEFNNSLIAIINKTGWVNNHNTANSNTKNHTNLPIAAIPE